MAGAIQVIQSAYHVMAEAIAAIIEALVALLVVTLELIALLIGLVVELVVGIFFPDRRHRAKAKWQSTSIGRRIAAGCTAVVMVGVVGGVLWFVLRPKPSGMSAPSNRLTQSPTNRLALEVQISSSLESNRSVKISIAEGELGKILAATNRANLLSRIKSSVVVTGHNGSVPTNVPTGRKLEIKIGRELNEN